MGEDVNHMNTVAILYICTGQYTVFWKDFYDSYERFFLPESQKEYYVFTDCKDLYQKDDEKVHIVFQESLGWPGNTLMRYHMFDRIREDLKRYDYLFFMNANCQCVDYVIEEDFLNPNGILVVQHPGYFRANNLEFPYERNEKSTAYIKKGEGEYYICGGVNGGTTESFLKLIETIKRNVDIDKEKRIIATWHDESHINRYIIDHPEFKMLSPAYCYAEGWDLPFEAKIIVRNKENWIDVKEAKKEKYWLIKKAKRKIRKLIG